MLRLLFILMITEYLVGGYEIEEDYEEE